MIGAIFIFEWIHNNDYKYIHRSNQKPQFIEGENHKKFYFEKSGGKPLFIGFQAV